MNEQMQYLVDLTDGLIKKNRYVEMRQNLGYKKEHFLTHVKVHLAISDVADMNPETQGRILSVINQLPVESEKFFGGLRYSMSGKELLLDMVSLALAHVIFMRIDGESLSRRGLPPYPQKEEPAKEKAVTPVTQTQPAVK